MAGLSALFFPQPDIAHAHAPIHGLAHIINREQGDLDRGQCLHFHPRLSQGFNGGLALDPLLLRIRVELHFHAGEHQRMAQGDQVSRPLGSHDPRNAGHTQYVAFLVFAVQDEIERIGLHRNIPFRDGDAPGRRLIAHVNHVGFTFGIEMSQFTHTTILTLEVGGIG